MAWLLVDTSYQFDLWMQIGMFLSGLFVACLFCHGELYRARPAARHLTAFYLTISAGGAIGGLLVAVVAPLAFNAYYELGLALVALALLAAVRFAPVNRRRALGEPRGAARGRRPARPTTARASRRTCCVSARNFYGVIRVKEYGAAGEQLPPAPAGARRDHARRAGHDRRAGGASRRTYYQPSSGVGAAMAARQASGPVRVGVIGLGTGTLAAYGRKGDVVPLLRHQSEGG